MLPKRVCRHFEIRHFGEYHDLYLKSDKLRLAYVFKTFRNMCLQIYHVDPVKLTWKAAIKGTEVKLELLS